jgi:hypothetical protein
VFKYWLASFVFASLLAGHAQAAGSIDTILAKAKASCEA